MYPFFFQGNPDLLSLLMLKLILFFFTLPLNLRQIKFIVIYLSLYLSVYILLPHEPITYQTLSTIYVKYTELESFV